jgi:hypothetical protein
MNQSSHLEIFPDELFLELFSYISPRDLYYSWNGLNRRINGILRSVRISFDLIDNIDENYRILKYFSRQIVYIHLCIPSNLIDFKEFINLRSLIIDTKLTSKQIESIDPMNLPNLRRLTFNEEWKSDDPLNEILFHQKTSNQWIKVCHLPIIPTYFLHNSLNCSHIQTMIFDRVTSCDINRLLFLQTTLRRLKVNIVSSIIDEKIWKSSFINLNYQHKYLIDFHTTMNTCNKLDELYPLLSNLSSLRYLHISCDNLTMYDFRQLALELHTRIPQLERFNCTFKQTYIENIEEVHSMSPLFTRMICKKIEWIGVWHYYCVTTGYV